LESLVAGYEAGKTVKELAASFGIDRNTVSRRLRQAGVTVRPRGLTDDQAAEAVCLYEAGWSSGRLAEKFGVSADTVLKNLRQGGVAIRPWRGGPAAKRTRS
jgi:DNA-directed RNA polymerase specialized sigma24 family protein